MTRAPRLSKKTEESIIAQALGILESRLKKTKGLFVQNEVVLDYLKINLSHLEHEVFGVLFLDIRYNLIKNHIMFNGTLNHTAVYPREIVKVGLRLNAANIILYHNHPSGDITPSPGDMLLTKDLRNILTKVGINLLDHIIVAGSNTFSFKAGELL